MNTCDGRMLVLFLLCLLACSCLAGWSYLRYLEVRAILINLIDAMTRPDPNDKTTLILGRTSLIGEAAALRRAINYIYGIPERKTK